MIYFGVFVASAVTMIYEIVGSRMLSPFFGNSLEVWTSLIAVVLGGLSYGFYIGGKVGDKNPSKRTFAFVFFFAGLLIFFTTIIKDVVGVLFSSALGISNTYISVILASLILFAPASILFGMITPLANRLMMKSVQTSGETIGRIGALGTIGSICGTILAGFFLLPYFGTQHILLSIGLVLSVLGVGFFYEYIFVKIFAIVLFFLTASFLPAHLTVPKNLVADIDTRYNRIQIFHSELPDKKELRVLTTDPYGIQCAAVVGEDKPYLEYVKFIGGLVNSDDSLKNLLMIGGCNHSFATSFLNTGKERTAQVVEIDPAMKEITEKYFGIKMHPALSVAYEDGRRFLTKTQGVFDVVVLDAFGSVFSIPVHLATKEMMILIKQHLEQGGIFVANLVDGKYDNYGEFLTSYVKTVKEVFPFVAVYKTGYEKDNEAGVFNYVLIASKNEKKVLDRGEKNKISEELLEGGIVFTDDFVPIEKMMSPVRAFYN